MTENSFICKNYQRNELKIILDDVEDIIFIRGNEFTSRMLCTPRLEVDLRRS